MNSAKLILLDANQFFKADFALTNLTKISQIRQIVMSTRVTHHDVDLNNNSQNQQIRHVRSISRDLRKDRTV